MLDTLLAIGGAVAAVVIYATVAVASFTVLHVRYGSRPDAPSIVCLGTLLWPLMIFIIPALFLVTRGGTAIGNWINDRSTRPKLPKAQVVDKKGTST
jgi:hypothetical protein